LALLGDTKRIVVKSDTSLKNLEFQLKKSFHYEESPLDQEDGLGTEEVVKDDRVFYSDICLEIQRDGRRYRYFTHK